MSHSNERELQLLRKHFLSLLSEEAPRLDHPINDLFIQLDCTAGELRLYDDTDEELSRLPVYAWEDTGSVDAPSEAFLQSLILGHSLLAHENVPLDKIVQKYVVDLPRSFRFHYLQS